MGKGGAAGDISTRRWFKSPILFAKTKARNPQKRRGWRFYPRLRKYKFAPRRPSLPGYHSLEIDNTLLPRGSLISPFFCEAGLVLADRARIFLLRITSFVGLLIGLFNAMSFFMMPGYTLWNLVLHRPLIFISLYGLLIPVLAKNDISPLKSQEKQTR